MVKKKFVGRDLERQEELHSRIMDWLEEHCDEGDWNEEQLHAIAELVEAFLVEGLIE